MSELAFTINPAGGNAEAILTTHLTAADIAVLKQAGNPVVDFGGPVTATIDAAPTTQTLPTNQVAVVDGLRVSFVFKEQGAVADNVAMAQAWVTKQTTAVNNALVAKRAEATAISGTLTGINSV